MDYEIQGYFLVEGRPSSPNQKPERAYPCLNEVFHWEKQVFSDFFIDARTYFLQHSVPSEGVASEEGQVHFGNACYVQKVEDPTLEAIYVTGVVGA